MVKSSLFPVAITLTYLSFLEIHTIPNMACYLSLCFYCFVTYTSINKALICIVVLEMYIYAGIVYCSSFYCCVNVQYFIIHLLN